MTAVVAGHVCLDIIPELQGAVVFEPGRLIEAGPAILMTGGAVSNTGQALFRLGVDVNLIGKVGDELFGRAIHEILEKNGRGLSNGLVSARDGESSYTIVVNLAGQDRMFLHAPGCNANFESSDVADAALAATQWMHFGYPPLMERMYAENGAELIALFRRAKSLGCTTSLDMSLPDAGSPSGSADWGAILTGVLPFVDLFLPSIEEALFMLDRPTFDILRGSRLSQLPVEVFQRLAAKSIELGAKIVGIKAGNRGLYLHSGPNLAEFGRGAPANPGDWVSRRLWAPCFLVDVVGTTGAGDATIAGLIMGILRGFGPQQSIQAAVAAGACCCERSDAVSGVLSWADTASRIQAGWPTLDANLPDGWVCCDGVFSLEA